MTPYRVRYGWSGRPSMARMVLTIAAETAVFLAIFLGLPAFVLVMATAFGIYR